MKDVFDSFADELEVTQIYYETGQCPSDIQLNNLTYTIMALKTATQQGKKEKVQDIKMP